MLKNNELEIRKINKRTKFLIGLIVLFFLIITIRFFHINLIQSSKLKEKAIDNITKKEYISPERGDIYDRNNNIIATTTHIYTVNIIPEKISEKENLIIKLSNILNIKKEEIEKTINSSVSFKKVQIKDNLNEEEFNKILDISEIFPSIKISSKKVRKYNYNDLFLHSLGYVGKVSRNDLKEYKDLNILKNDYIGKTGIEKELNYTLYGQRGIKEKIINASGKVIKEYIKKSPKKGKNIKLTLDLELQKIAKEKLGNYKGAVIAINPKNGEILAYYSNPSYDANKFIKGISQKEYKKVFSKESPLFDRITQGAYPPASTIKPFISIAALIGDFIDPEKEVFCGPYFRIGNKKFRDWKRWGHGDINMVQSIARSVDVYYYKLGFEMGVDFIHDVLQYFYFGKNVPIQFLEKKQNSGLLPSNKWKIEKYKEPFYKGEEVVISIGQGQFMTTPLQMAYSNMLLANNGFQHTLSFIKDEKLNQNSKKIDIPQKYIDIVKEGMREVMHGEKGTGRSHAKDINFIMAGKTGTSQVFSTRGEIDYENEDIKEELRDHGLFNAFAPFENPEIAVTVVAEHSGSGSKGAAPIAMEIIKAYMNKREKENEFK